MVFRRLATDPDAASRKYLDEGNEIQADWEQNAVWFVNRLHCITTPETGCRAGDQTRLAADSTIWRMSSW